MEGTEIWFGSDWCTLEISEYCLRGKGNRPSKCLLLGPAAKACKSCLRDLYRGEFEEDFEWTLKETWHQGECQKDSVDLAEIDGVIFCPRCLLKVLLEHNPRIFDWIIADCHDNRHAKVKQGLEDDLDTPWACRECLLIALYLVDDNFFDLITTKRGKELIERLLH